jgi:perosamine synthetase
VNHRPSAAPARVSLPFPRLPKYGPAETRAAVGLMESGRLSETSRGPATTGLEDDFAALTETQHALAFNSGTASLHAALHAVGAHDHAGVITSPLTWISAITAAFHAGSFPIFCDLEADSPNLAAATAREAADRSSAVLVTHAFGIPARQADILAAVPLPLVEDCSHAHGALYQGRPVGSWGAAGCFSLQDSKVVSGGEGGVLTTSDHAIYQRALTLGHHPHRLDVELTDPALRLLAETGAGYKYRIHPLAAAIARANLRHLPERMAAAEANLAHLLDVLAAHDAPITVPSLDADSVRGWYGTPLTVTEPVPDPAALYTACTAAGISLRPLYPDWLRSPLLKTPAVLHRFWPHVKHTPYTVPVPDAFPTYYRARRQTLWLKIPQLPALDYMEQVATALAQTLASELTPST